jgi:hypothetical protein
MEADAEDLFEPKEVVNRFWPLQKDTGEILKIRWKKMDVINLEDM